jgi:DNA-binding CsgD family transcriptional regulator
VLFSPQEAAGGSLLIMTKYIDYVWSSARLELSEPSAKTFIGRAARKLGARSQLHAVAITLRKGVI